MAFKTTDECGFLVFGVSNAKYLAFDTLDGNVLIRYVRKRYLIHLLARFQYIRLHTTNKLAGDHWTNKSIGISLQKNVFLFCDKNLPILTDYFSLYKKEKKKEKRKEQTIFLFHHNKFLILNLIYLNMIFFHLLSLFLS